VRAKLLSALVALVALAGRADSEPDVSLPASDVIAGPWKLIALASDGSWVAFSSRGGVGDKEAEAGRVQVWNLKTGALTITYAAPGIARTEKPSVVSPDGKWLAYTRHVDYKAEVRVYELHTGKRSRVIRDLGDEPFAVGFSADGKELFTANYPGNGSKRIVAWSLADGTKSREIALPRFERVTIAPDGKTAVVETSRGDGQELWDLATGKKVASLGRESIYRTPQFLRGGKEVAMLYNYSTPGPDYRVWEVGPDKKPTAVKIPGKSKDPVAFALTDDRSAVAVLEYYGDLRVFDAGKAEPRFTFALKAAHGEGLRFTPDGKRLIVIDPLERAWVLDAATGKPVFALDPDYRSVKTLAFTADGKSLVAGMAQWPKVNSSGSNHAPDGFILTWDAATGELTRACGRTDNFLDAVFPSPDGAKAIVVTAEYSNRAEWWDLKAGKRLKVLATPDDGAGYFGASADGKKVGATHYRYEKTPDGGRGGYLQDVWVWNPATGERLPDIDAKSDVRVSFTPDGKTALVRDAAVRAARTAGGKPTKLWNGTDAASTTRYPEEPVILPDGESFVAYHRPQQYGLRDLYFYDVGRQFKLGTTDLPTGRLAVSPDGKWVACGGIERDKANPVYLWRLPELGPLDEKQLKPGKLITDEAPAKRVVLEGHIGEVFAVCFSPDGKTLATGGRDKLIRLWDVKSGKLKASLWAVPPTERDGVPSDWVAFTPDGTHAGTPRGRAFLRFKDGGAEQFHNAEKVKEAIRGK
jgi:WD40 repeat protein